jgi:hypothetical protein
MQANDSHWLMREILLYWKRRVLKRVDLTSRTIATMARTRLVLCRARWPSCCLLLTART